MHCTVWCTQLWGTVEKNWVQLKRLNCLHFLNVIFLHCSFYCREKRDFVILYTFSEYYSMSKFSKHLNFLYKFMTTKKSINSIPPKRHCILVTLKCYLIWILGVVSLGIFGMSEIWVQGLPMTTNHSWGAFWEAVLFSSVYVSQVLGLGSHTGWETCQCPAEGRNRVGN